MRKYHQVIYTIRCQTGGGSCCVAHGTWTGVCDDLQEIEGGKVSINMTDSCSFMVETTL